MQLKNTTDYAIRIVCHLAMQSDTVTTSELANELKVPGSYIPKITKKLKEANIIIASEGIKGGYSLAKKPEDISLFDIISATEVTMKINRCLEKDGFCSRNATDYCRVHKVLLKVQETYQDSLQNVKVADIIRPEKEEHFEPSYAVIKVNLSDKSYECLYSRHHSVYQGIKKAETYDECLNAYTDNYVHESDKDRLKAFLGSGNLTGHTSDGCQEESIFYQRRCETDADTYLWIEVKKCVDEKENTAILIFHNAKTAPNLVANLEQELCKQKQDVTERYWHMVYLLGTVLNRSNMVEAGNRDDICFFTEKIYRQLQKHYPEYGITEGEIENVSHLAPIYDVGKIKIPAEILNKTGQLTADEMKTVKQYPVFGAEMILKIPNDSTTRELNKYSYEICRYHHERYDGTGYPDGLKEDEIPLCAQVVGLVVAYNDLISARVYKPKLKNEEAIRKIVNGECGVFSNKLLQCFIVSAMQEEWMGKVKQRE